MDPVAYLVLDSSRTKVSVPLMRAEDVESTPATASLVMLETMISLLLLHIFV